jgi:hypothetical protein
MAPIQSPKKRGGRPRKHLTDTDAAAAARESKLRSYHRSKQRSRQLNGPADFIAYEPPHPDLPTHTPPSGLRTSPHIRIPLDDDAQQTDAPESPRPISLPATTRHPLRDAHDEAAAQIQQIQIDEQESNLESGEYYATISHRMSEMDAEAARILIGLRSVNTGGRAEGPGGMETLVLPSRGAPVHPTIDGSDLADKRERVCDGEPLLSCFSTAASMDEPIMTLDNDGVAASTPSNGLANIQRSRQSSAITHAKPEDPFPAVVEPRHQRAQY